MDNHYWGVELRRIVLVIFFAVVLGSVSGYWLASFCLASIVYSGWLLYKLYELNHWLRNQNYNSPASTGIWERIENRILDIQHQNERSEKQTSKLLKRLQGIIKGLPYATVILNHNNAIDWANETALIYLNIDIEKDRGQRIDNLLRSPKVAKLVKKKRIKEIAISLPHRPDRHLSIQYAPVQKDLKLLLARDISDQINVQQMRKNFISNASHELRTPLTVIAGYLEMLAEDEDLPEHLKQAVEHSSTQSTRMKSIIEDMLTLSRLEKSELDHDSCTSINVPSILNTICKDEIKITSNNSHHITTKIDENLYILGVESEIFSVCSNLIQNAIKHTPAQTNIKLSWLKSEHGQAILSVKDDGPGIPEEHIEKLTQRFYRVDKSRSRDRGGTGLGLAIVQHILQRHSGQLKISSAINQGSCFNAIFPKHKVIEIE